MSTSPSSSTGFFEAAALELLSLSSFLLSDANPRRTSLPVRAWISGGSASSNSQLCFSRQAFSFSNISVNKRFYSHT